MKKRLLAMFLTVMMIVSMVPLQTFAFSSANTSGCSKPEDHKFSYNIEKKVYVCIFCGVDCQHPEANHQEFKKAPTCMDDGIEGIKCTLCGDFVKSQAIPAKGEHTWENGKCTADGCGAICGHPEANRQEFKVAATCMEEGKEGVECTLCGAVVKSQAIPAKGEHTWENGKCTADGCGAICGHPEANRQEFKVAATCTENGKEGVECTLCGSTVKSQEIAATGHSWVADKVAPTCEEDGYEYSVCENCKEENEFKKVIPAFGHDFHNARCIVCGASDPKCEHPEGVEKYTAPTCTDAGSHSFWCPECNFEKMEILPALGHEKLEKREEATCTKDGLVHVVCTRCNELLLNEVLPGGHKYQDGACAVCGNVCTHEKGVEKFTEATCMDAGSHSFWCPECNFEKMEMLPQLEHEKLDKSYAATCTEEGREHVVCTKCDQVLLDNVIEAKGHDFHNARCIVCGASDPKCPHPDGVEKYTAPTCTDAGSHSFWCPECNFEKMEILPALGHEKLEKREEATCTEDGLLHVVCTRCNELLLDEILPAGHKFQDGACTGCDFVCNHEKGVEKFTEATCNDEGCHSFWCETCNFEKMEMLPKLEHEKLDKSYAATCTEEGREHVVCTKCDRVLLDNVIEAKGHDFHNARCIVCGASDPKCPHPDGVEKYTAPTCTDAGSHSFWCPECNFEKMEILPALGHMELVKTEPATCTEDGLVHVVCVKCSQLLWEKTMPAGHQYQDGICTGCGFVCNHEKGVEKLTEATCTDEGCHSFWCETCNFEKMEMLPKLEHEKLDKSYAATCTEDGREHVVCTLCDQVLMDNVIEAKGHDFQNARCTVCGASDPKCEHPEGVEKYTAPTCTDAGSHSFWCPECNFEKMEILPALGHEKLEKREEATCTKTGLLHVVCTRCNQLLQEEVLPVKAHTYVDGKCACGAKDPDYVVIPGPTDIVSGTDKKIWTWDLQDVFLLEWD